MVVSILIKSSLAIGRMKKVEEGCIANTHIHSNPELKDVKVCQVLVDEESDGLGRLHLAKDGEIQSFRDGDDGGSSSGDKVSEDKSVGPCLGVRRRDSSAEWSEALDSELEDEEETTWEVFSSAEEKARASNERARRAEVAASLAAAQAVAALRVAEEARAEAEAAKKAAEEAMNKALDQCGTVLKPESLDEDNGDLFHK